MERNCTSLGDNACEDFFVKCYSKSSSKKFRLDPNPKTLVSKLDYDSRRLKIITECMEKFGPKRKLADVEDTCKRMKTNHDFGERSLDDKAFQAFGNKANDLISVNGQSRIEKPRKSMHLNIKKFSEKLQDMKNSGCFSLTKNKEKTFQPKAEAIKPSDNLCSSVARSDDDRKNAVDEQSPFPNICIPHHTCISISKECTGHLTTLPSEIHTHQFNNTNYDPKSNIFDICKKFHNEKINKMSSKLTNLSDDDVLANKVIVFNKKLSEIFAKNTKLCSKNVGSAERSLTVVESSSTVASKTRESDGVKSNAIQSPVGTSQVIIAICDDSKSSFSASLNSSLLPTPSTPAKTPTSSPVVSSSRDEILLPADAPSTDSVPSEMTECSFVQNTSFQLEKDVCFNFEKFRNFLSFKNHGCALDSKKDDESMSSVGGLDSEVTTRLENISSNNNSLLHNANVLDQMAGCESQSSEISKKNFCKDDSDVVLFKKCSNKFKKSHNLKYPGNLQLKNVAKSVKKLQARRLKTIRKKYCRTSKPKHSNVIHKVVYCNETGTEEIVDGSSNEEFDKRSIFSVHQNIPIFVNVDIDPNASKVGDPKQSQMKTDSQHHQDLTICHNFEYKESNGCLSCHVDGDTCNLNSEVVPTKGNSCNDENLKDFHEIPAVNLKTDCIHDRLQTSSLCLSNDIKDAENSVISILSFCNETKEFDSQHHSTKSLQTAVSTKSWIENQKNNVDFDEAHQSQSSNINDLLDCNWVSVVEELEKSEDSKKPDCKNEMPSYSGGNANMESSIAHDTLIEKDNNDVNKHNEISSMPPSLQKDDLTHDVLDSPHFAQLSVKDGFLHTYPLNVKHLCDDIHDDNDKFKHDGDDDGLLSQSDISMKLSDQEHVGYVSNDDCKFNNADLNNNSPFEFDLIDQCILNSMDGKISLDANHSDASQMTIDSGVTSKVSSLGTGDRTSSPVVSFNVDFNKEFSTSIILKEKSTKLNDSEFFGSKENHFCESFETMDDDSFSENVRKDNRLSNSNMVSSSFHDSPDTLYLEKSRHDQQVETDCHSTDTDEDEKQTKLDQESFANDFIHDNDSKNNKNVEQCGEMIHNDDKSERNVSDDDDSVNDVADQEIAIGNRNEADDVHKAIDNTRILNKSFNNDDKMDRCSNQGDEIDFGNYALNCHYHYMQCSNDGEVDCTSFVESMRSTSPSDGDSDDDDKDNHSKSPVFQSHFEEHDGISLFGSYVDSEDETRLTNEEKLWDNITDNSDDDNTNVVGEEEDVVEENKSSYVDRIEYGYCHSKHHPSIDSMEKRGEDNDLDSFQNDMCNIDYLTNQSKNNDPVIVNNENENCLDDKSDGNLSDGCENGISGDYNDIGVNNNNDDDSLNNNLYFENSGSSKNMTLLTTEDHWLSDISITDSDDDSSNSADSSYVDNEYHPKEIRSGKESDVGDINDFNNEDNFDQEVSRSSSAAENSISDIEVKCCKTNNKLDKHPSSNLSLYSNAESERDSSTPPRDDECAERSVGSIDYNEESWSDDCDELDAVIVNEASDPCPNDVTSTDDDCNSRTSDEMNSKQLFGDGISSSDESSSSADECRSNIHDDVGFPFGCDEEQCYRSLTTGCDVNVNSNDGNNSETNLIEAKGTSKFQGGINAVQGTFDKNEAYVYSKNGSDADDSNVDDNFGSPNYYSYEDEMNVHTGNKHFVKMNGKENGFDKHCDSPSRNTDAADVSENSSSSSEADEEECNSDIKDSGCYEDEGILFDNYHNSRLPDHGEEDGIVSNDFNFSGNDNGGGSRNECETNASDDHCHFVDTHPSHSESSRVDQSVSDNSLTSYQNFPNDCPGKLEPFDPALNTDSYPTNENCETLQTEMLCNLAIKSDLDFDNDLIDRQYNEIGGSHDKLYCAATTVGQCIDGDQKVSFPDPMSTNVQSMMAEYAEIYNRMGYSNSSIDLCSRFRNSQLSVTDLFADFDDSYAGYPENQVNDIYKQYSLASTYRDLYVAYNYTNGYDFYRHYNDIIKMHCRSYNYEPTSDEENNGLDLRIKTNQSRDAGSHEQESSRKENDVPGINNISEVVPMGLNLDTGKLVAGSVSPSDFKNKIFMEKQCDDDDDDIDEKYCTWEEISRASYQENSSAFCSSDVNIAFNDSDFRKKAMVYKELNEDCNRADSGGDDDDDDETVRIDDFVDFGNQTIIKEKNEAFLNVDGNTAKEIEGDMLRVEGINGRELVQACKTSNEQLHDFDEGESENYEINTSNEFKLNVSKGAIATDNSNDKGESISIDQYLYMKTDEKRSQSGHNSTCNGEFHKFHDDRDIGEGIHDTCDDIPEKQTCGADSQNWGKSFDEALPLSCSESNFPIDNENVSDGDKDVDDQISQNSTDHAFLKTLTPSCDSNFEQEEKCYYSSGGQNFNEAMNFLHEKIPSPLNLTLKEFSGVAKSHEFEKICNLELKETEAADEEHSISHQRSTLCDFKEIGQSLNMNAIHLNSDINFNTLDNFVSEETRPICSDKMNVNDGNITMKSVSSPALDEQFSSENTIDDGSDSQQKIIHDEVDSNDGGKAYVCSKDVNHEIVIYDNKQRICDEDRVMDPSEDDITELNKGNAVAQGRESSHHQEVETSHTLDEKHDPQEDSLDHSVNHNFNSFLLSANMPCVSYHGDETIENFQTIDYGNDRNTSGDDITFDCTGCMDIEQSIEDSDIKDHDNGSTNDLHFVTLSEDNEKNATSEHLRNFMDDDGDEHDFLGNESVNIQRDFSNDGPHAIISCKEPMEDTCSNEQTKFSNPSNCNNKTALDDASLLHDGNQANTKNPSGYDICIFNDNPNQRCEEKGNSDLEVHNASPPQVLNRNDEQYEDYVISTEEYDDFAHNNFDHNNDSIGKGLDNQGITEDYSKESLEAISRVDEKESKDLESEVRTTYNGNNNNHQDILDERNLEIFSNYNKTSDGTFVVSRDECDFDCTREDSNNVDFCGSPHLDSSSPAKTRCYSGDKTNSQMIEKSQITFGIASNLMEDSSDVHAKNMDFCAESASVCFSASHDTSPRSNCKENHSTVDHCKANGLEKTCKLGDCYASEDSLSKSTQSNQVDDLDRSDLKSSESSNGLGLILDKFGDKSSNGELCNLSVCSTESYIPVQSPHEKVNKFEVNVEADFDNILESEVSSIHKNDERCVECREVETTICSLKPCSNKSKEDSSNDTANIGDLADSADQVEHTVEDDVSSPPRINLIENNHDEHICVNNKLSNDFECSKGDSHDEHTNDNNKLSDDFEHSKSDYNPDVRDEMTADDTRNKHDLQKSARNVFDDMMISLTSMPLKFEEFTLERVISNESKQADPMVNTSGEKLEAMSPTHPFCSAKMTNSNSLSQNITNARCISERSIETPTPKKDLVESNIKYQDNMSEKSLTNLLDGFEFSKRNCQAQSGIGPQSSSNSFFQVQSDMSGMLQEEPVDDDPEELQAAVESILNIDFFSSKYADDEDLHQIENNEFVDRYDCNYFSNADRSPVLPSLEKGDAIDFMSSDILNGEEDDEDEASRDGKELAMKFYSTCQQKDPDNRTYNIHTPTLSLASQSGLEGSNISAESSSSAMEVSNSMDEIPSECLPQGNKANFFKSFKSKWLSMNNNSDPKHFDKQALSLMSEKTSKAMYCRSLAEKNKKRKNLKKQRKARHWKYSRLDYIIQKFQKLKFQAQRRKQLIQRWGKKSVKNTEAENYFIACFKSKLYIGYEPNDDFSLNDFKNKNIFYLGSPCGMSSCSFFRESERREHLNGPEASGHEKYLLRKPVFLYESGCLGNQRSFVKLLSKPKLPPVNQKQNSCHDKASTAMQHHPSSSCSYKDTMSQGNSQNLSCIISADVKNSFDASYGFKDDSYAMMASERKRAYHCPNDVVELDNMPKETFQTKCKGDMLEMKCPSMPYYDESINSSGTHIIRAKPEPHYNIHLDHLPSYAELNNVCTLQRVKVANRPIRPTPLYKESFSGFPAMGQGFPNYRLTHLSARNIGEACCLPASDNVYKGQPGILPENSASTFVSQMKNGLQTHLASRLNLPPVHGYVSNLTNPRMVVNQNDCHMFGANYIDHSSRHSIHPESYHLQRHYIPYADFQAPYRYSVSYSGYPSSGSLKIGAQGSTVPQTDEAEQCHTVIDNNGHRAALRSQTTDNDSFKHSHIHSFNSKDVFDLREVYLPRNSSDMSSYSMLKLKAKKSEQPTSLDHNFSRNKLDKKKDVVLHPANLSDLHDVASKDGGNRLGNRAQGSLKANYQIETLLMNPGNVRTRNYKQTALSSNPPISHPYYQPNVNAGFTEIPIYKFYPDTFCNYSASVADHPNNNHYNPSRNYRGNVNLSNVYRYSLSSDKFNGNLH